jgi:hypothetical protein
MFSFKGRTLIELNAAFEVWLNRIYHQRQHGATGQTPFARFTDNMKCLRPAPDNLTDHFRQRVRRKVAKDRTITLNGRLFEAPVALIGQQVELLYHNHRPDQVEVIFKQRSYGMARRFSCMSIAASNAIRTTTPNSSAPIRYSIIAVATCSERSGDDQLSTFFWPRKRALQGRSQPQ